VAFSSARSDNTRSAVLAHIGAHGAASRADLARSLRLSPALITRVSKALIADGLVLELDMTPSSGGRPAQLLGLVDASMGAIGLKIAPDHVTLVEVGLDGVVTRSTTEPFDAQDQMALSAVADITSRFQSDSHHATILGIGVGIPGNVQDQSEDVVDSTQLGWNRVPLGGALRAATGLPVLIDNNVNALALAESLYGAGRAKDDFLVVTIGTGIGAGVMANGSIVRGHTGNAGEIGHIPTRADGPQCQCGAHGCLESLIGQRALVNTARDKGAIGPSGGIAALHRAAATGDSAAQAVLEEAGYLLGRAVAGVVNTLDPELIVVLGEGAESWAHWSVGFEPALRSGVIPRNRGIRVAVEAWQDDRWAQGAACLVLGTPFDSDGVSGEQGRLVRERLVERANQGSHS